MRKLFALLTIVLFAGFAFAQNTLTSTQSGASTAWAHPNINDIHFDQNGSNNNININQSSTTLWNEAYGSQDGTGLNAYIDQSANGSNDLDRLLQSSSNGLVDLDQVAGGNNFATIWSQNGANNEVIIDQEAGNNNAAKYTSYGSNFTFNVKQEGAINNDITGQGGVARQGNWGFNYTDNKVVGALPGAWGYSVVDDLSPAYQKSNNSSNTLSIDQFDGSNNVVGLYQTAEDFNSTSILQQGNYNSLSVYQTNVDGSNSVITSQVGDYNTASIYQSTSTGAGVINVTQN